MLKRIYTFNLELDKKVFLDFLENKKYTLTRLHEWMSIESPPISYKFDSWNPKAICNFQSDKTIKIETSLWEIDIAHISLTFFAAITGCIIWLTKWDFSIILYSIFFTSIYWILILVLFWLRENSLIEEIKNFLSEEKKNSV